MPRCATARGSSWSHRRPVDVGPECASMLERLCLAQAQELTFDKARLGGSGGGVGAAGGNPASSSPAAATSPAVRARLAAAAAALYCRGGAGPGLPASGLPFRQVLGRARLRQGRPVPGRSGGGRRPRPCTPPTRSRRRSRACATRARSSRPRARSPRPAPASSPTRSSLDARLADGPREGREGERHRLPAARPRDLRARRHRPGGPRQADRADRPRRRVGRRGRRRALQLRHPGLVGESPVPVHGARRRPGPEGRRRALRRVGRRRGSGSASGSSPTAWTPWPRGANAARCPRGRAGSSRRSPTRGACGPCKTWCLGSRTCAPRPRPTLRRVGAEVDAEARDDESLRSRHGSGSWDAPPSSALNAGLREKLAGYGANLAAAGESDARLAHAAERQRSVVREAAVPAGCRGLAAAAAAAPW